MRKALLLMVATVCVFLALGGVALAASSQDIYDDYAQDKKLDGTYTDAELEAFLTSAVTLQYTDQAVLADLIGVVNTLLASNENGGGSGDDGESGRGQFPFTGAELILLAGAGVALVGGGFGGRRLLRR